MEQRFVCFVDGTQAGELTVTRQGLYWKVEAVTVGKRRWGLWCRSAANCGPAA